MVDDSIQITSITPYGRPERPRVRLPIGGATAVGFGWPAVAMLAVLASFLRVYSVSISVPDTDNGVAGFLRYAVDGWGRSSITHTAPGNFYSSVPGPRYGLLFCIAAGVVLLGWLQSLWSPRSAGQPFGRALSGAGCAFLTGVVACEIIATLPSRKSLSQINGAFSFGPSPWLAGGACVLGAVTWAAQYRAQRTVVVADSELAVSPLPAEPQVETSHYTEQRD
jgi:hypothetical protein